MNRRSGWRGLHARDQRRPELLAGAGPRALAPRAREDLVGHQHRHVAAQRRRTGRRCRSSVVGDRVAQRRRERVELHDVGPRREVRVAAAGEDRRRPCAGTPPGRARRSSSVPRTKHSGRDVDPGVVGRDVVGHVVEDQPEPARGERAARRGERRPARRSARRRRSRARSTATRSRRSSREVGQRGAVAARRARVGPRDREAGRAALPDAHQPHGVDGQRGERVPLRVGDLGERERTAAVAAEALEPDGGVDLVDRRAGAAGASGRSGRARGAAPGSRAERLDHAGAAARRCPSSRSGGWRRCRRRCRRGSTRGTAAGRASAGRSGTSRCRRTPGRRPCSSRMNVARQPPADLRAPPRAGSSRCPEPVGHSILKRSP